MSIELNHVSKQFNSFKVLNDITLTAKSNEILGLIGPSGAGKTTLIRLMIGSLKADQGSVTMNGENMPNIHLFKQFGFMPQAEALYQDLSGIDNLKFFGRLYGLKGKQLNNRCQELLTFMNLSHDQHKLVSLYSGGMKKRLSLIVALLHDPTYLILDEPTVGIDPVLRKRIWERFEALAQSGKTIIVSTHVMDEANKCHACALIKKGKLLAFDRVDRLIASTSDASIESLFFIDEEVSK